METIEQPPFARIYGEPMLEIPADLYIPPEALAVILEAFEGPLDLLLYLIRKQNLNVLDIPMAELTRQYMNYVGMMGAGQIELAAEYLLMAALLIEIKSRMLLPRRAVTEEEEADPRAALVRRLLEYEQMKLAAQKLDALEQNEREFVIAQAYVEQIVATRLPQVAPIDLSRAWQQMMERTRVTQHHRIEREQLSVREYMTRILRRLRVGEQFVDMTDLFVAQPSVAEVVVTFLAILELAKESLIEISQPAPFAPIYVSLCHAESAAH